MFGRVLAERHHPRANTLQTVTVRAAAQCTQESGRRYWSNQSMTSTNRNGIEERKSVVVPVSNGEQLLVGSSQPNIGQVSCRVLWRDQTIGPAMDDLVFHQNTSSVVL